MRLKSYYDIYPSKEDCISYLEKIFWKGNPICPYCKSNSYSELKEKNRYHCNTCNTSYSVTVGTIFHKTRVDLQKWFYAIDLVVNSIDKIPSRVLSNKIGTTKDTAWRMIKEIKNSLLKQDDIIYKILNYGKD